MSAAGCAQLEATYLDYFAVLARSDPHVLSVKWHTIKEKNCQKQIMTGASQNIIIAQWGMYEKYKETHQMPEI